MDKIEKPKVFISYAWGSQEYDERIVSFAASLVDNGIEVVIDKWNLLEGNDTYSFMEQSVLDPTITNVLLLLDPLYEKKANSKQGGVGTETQIISSEVYNKTDQTKYIPVIFSRKQNGSIPKPVYLRGTLHFDLSTDENYEKEYRRLVKRLYGVEDYKRPELGKKPAWVDEQIDVSAAKRITKYDNLKNLSSREDRKLKYIENINEFISTFNDFDSKNDKDPIEIYKELKPLRDDALALFSLIPYSRDCIIRLTDALDKLRVEISINQKDLLTEMKRSLLHELFIYLVAICYKNDLYEELGYLLNRPYAGDYDNKPKSFRVFYHYNGPLDQAVCNKDNTNYYSGTANIWIENINASICDKKEFVLADLLCFNNSIIQVDREMFDHYWFPLTYVYMTDNNQSLFRLFANGMVSKRKAEQAALIFGYSDLKQFEARLREIADSPDETDGYRHIRYGASFESPATIFDMIDIEQIATKK